MDAAKSHGNILEEASNFFILFTLGLKAETCKPLSTLTVLTLGVSVAALAHTSQC